MICRNKRTLIPFAASLLAAGSLAASASAGARTFNVTLDGLQEVPPVVTSGIGSCVVSLDDVTGDVKVSGTYSNLSSDAISAHIHGAAPPGQNAGVIVSLMVSGGKSGTITGSGTLTAQQLADMLAGLTYLNCHSVMHSTGEIRGQICPTNASWTNYGMGWPGTLGIPQFTASADPIQGTTITLNLDNSMGFNTIGILFIGLARANISTKLGGTILVVPILVVPLGIPAGGLPLPGPISNDPAFCGLTVDLQVLESDSGASKGVSFTPGLELVFGS